MLKHLLATSALAFAALTFSAVETPSAALTRDPFQLWPNRSILYHVPPKYEAPAGPPRAANALTRRAYARLGQPGL